MFSQFIARFANGYMANNNGNPDLILGHSVGKEKERKYAVHALYRYIEHCIIYFDVYFFRTIYWHTKFSLSVNVYFIKPSRCYTVNCSDCGVL